MNVPEPEMPLSDRGARLLVFVAHPDDEHLVGAGAIARSIAAGVDVRVVYASRGEAGRDRRGQVASGDALAALREAETRASVDRLGGGDVVFLGLPDGGLELDAGRGALLWHLTDHAPDVVLTFGSDGAYGHPDHQACPEIVSAGVACLPQTARPWILHAAYPRDLFQTTFRMLSRLNIGVSCPSEGLGVSPSEVDIRVNTREIEALKLAALACHASQLAHGDPRSFLPGGVVEALLREEWFTIASEGTRPLVVPFLDGLS